MSSSFVANYLTLFDGRKEFYAIRLDIKDGKSLYFPSNYGVLKTQDNKWVREKVAEIVDAIGSVELDEVSVLAHLKGEQHLGVYPIKQDNTVTFFALDFDGKNGDPWKAAKSQYDILTNEAELKVYLERSQSGNGYHIWGFLEAAVPARKVRKALSQYIVASEVYDRMFPNQDQLDSNDSYGNLIALPLAGKKVVEGKSVFIQVGEDGEPDVIEDQKAFVSSIDFISADLIEELYQAAATTTISTDSKAARIEDNGDGLAGAFKVTHPKYGCEWVRWCYDNPKEVGEPEWWALAQQFAQLQGGRELFHEWSARDPDRYDELATDRKFDNALKKNKPQRCDTLRAQVRGTPCHCDERFPDIVTHPYDLAKVSLMELFDSIKEDKRIESAKAGLIKAVSWAKRVHKNPQEGVGIPYGIEEIDKHTGLRDSDLIIIAARPGVGKTAFGLDVSYRVACTGVPVYFFSLEMSADQLWKRVLARAAEVDHGRMATGQLNYREWRRLFKAQKDLEKRDLPFFVDDVTRYTGDGMEVAASLVSKYGKGLIVWDYLQLAAKLPKESTFDAVTRNTNDLKLMGKALGVPVIALTQLNRAAEEAELGSTPSDSWLRGSGDIEQTADVIWFMLGARGSGIKMREMHQTKDRHRGSGAVIPLEFNQPLMKFGKEGTWVQLPSGYSGLPENAEDVLQGLDLGVYDGDD